MPSEFFCSFKTFPPFFLKVWSALDRWSGVTDMDLSFLGVACSCSTSNETLKRFGLTLYSCSGSVFAWIKLELGKNHRFKFGMHNCKHWTGTTPLMNIQWTSPTNFSINLHQKSQLPSTLNNTSMNPKQPPNKYIFLSLYLISNSYVCKIYVYVLNIITYPKRWLR